MTSNDAVTSGDAPALPAHEQPLLKINDLSVEFAAQHGWVRVVDGVSLSVNPGEVVGLVGESGSGKTVTGLSVMRLVPQPPGRFAGGSIVFDGQDLRALSAKEMRRIQGSNIAMVFQEPMRSLNPVYSVCLLYTSPSPRDGLLSRMPSSA